MSRHPFVAATTSGRAAGARRARALLALVTTVVALLAGLPAPAQAAPGAADLRAAVLKALGGSGAKASGAAVVVDGMGLVVNARGATPLVPASNQKMFTAGTALLRLGPDHRLRTEVRAAAPVGPDGTVAGDLVLVGGGDPALSAARLDALAASVAAAGVRHVAGALRVDDTRYDRARVAPGWKRHYMPAYTGPLSAVALDANAWRRDPAYLADPATPAGVRFVEALRRAGVGVAGPVVLGPAAPTDVAVAAHESPPVRNLASVVLKQSDNFYAEQLLKEVGASAARPTTAGGVAVVDEVAAGFGIDLARVVDGSGLSGLDRQTAFAEVGWLQSMGKTPVAETFRSALALPCEPGTTLAFRMCATAAVGRVWAKTGTLTDTVALAGYATTASGRPVWFAFVLNGVRSIARARAAVDAAAVALAAFSG